LVLIINTIARCLVIATVLLSTQVLAQKSATDYPKRIIALSPHAVELLYAIGAGDNIVATISHADYPEAAKNIEIIGDYRGITIEKLISLKPDLVITWPSGNKMNQVQQIEKLGFNVIASDPITLDDIASDLRALGKLTGHSEQAEIVAKKFEQELALLTKQ